MNKFRVELALLCVCFALLSTTTMAKPHPGVDYVKTMVSGIPVHLVDVDLSRDDLVVRPVVVPTGHRKNFRNMVKEHRPVAAVNGTFFDTRTGITVGNLVSQGRLLSEGMTGSNLVFHRDGTVKLLSSSRNLGRYNDWSEVDFAVGGGPTLLAQGKYFMDPASEGFQDPSLFKPRPRTAIGVTENGRLRMVVVTQGINLWKLAHIMKDLNCVHAINLDGGSSTALSVGGTTMVNPGRQLTNILGVFPLYQQPTQVRAIQVAQTRAMAHYQKGQQLLQSGEIRLARSQMRQAVSKAPEQAVFWQAAGLAEVQFGDLWRGIQDLHKAASLYWERGDLASATELAEKILTLDEKNMKAHLLGGECKFAQGLDAEAQVHLEFVLQMHPGHPRATELMDVLAFRRLADDELQSSGSTIQKMLANVTLGSPTQSLFSNTLPIE